MYSLVVFKSKGLAHVSQTAITSALFSRLTVRDGVSCVKVTRVVVVNDLTPWWVTGLLKLQDEHKANYCIPVFTFCIRQWVITLAFASLTYYN